MTVKLLEGEAIGPIREVMSLYVLTLYPSAIVSGSRLSSFFPSSLIAPKGYHLLKIPLGLLNKIEELFPWLKSYHLWINHRDHTNLHCCFHLCKRLPNNVTNSAIETGLIGAFAQGRKNSGESCKQILSGFRINKHKRYLQLIFYFPSAI